MNKLIRKILIVFIVLLCLSALFIYKGNNYLQIAMLIGIGSCLLFYYKYDQRKVYAREVVIISIMCALIIVSRLAFAFLPGIKPLISLVIISGVIFNKEAGFMCGSLSILLSNMFFAQGPWTPYQMLIVGLIGYFAGVLASKKLFTKYFKYIYGFVTGILFSIIIDFFSVLGVGFQKEKYIALLISSIPFMMMYAISNVVFIYLFYDVMVLKLTRIKNKFGIGNENIHIRDEGL